MPISTALSIFQLEVAQCNSLIANANVADATGSPLLPKADRDQISEAAFLNFFRAWERLLEGTITNFMMGSNTLNGTTPNRIASPPNLEAASKMLKGTTRYFDFGNLEHVRLVVGLFFDDGYPYEPHLASINSIVLDIKTIRNSCAHGSTNTQRALESLALRLLGSPNPGISVSDLLVATMPRTSTSATVFSHYQNILMSAAAAITLG